MPAYDCDQSLLRLLDHTLGVAICIDELKKGGERNPGMDDSILAITTELVSWGMKDKETFRNTLVFVPQLCREILSDLHGAERWVLRFGLTTDEVYEAFYPEFENLRKVLLREEDADMDKAKKFCLCLNRVGCAQWVPPRRYLA